MAITDRCFVYFLILLASGFFPLPSLSLCLPEPSAINSGPLSPPSSDKSDPASSEGNGKLMDAWSEEDMDEKEDVSEDDNEKNGELLMEYYYNLPVEVSDMLVEMDIINTPEVEKIRSSDDGDTKEEAAAAINGREGREKKAASNHQTFRKWTGNRIPYVLSPTLSTNTRDIILEAMDEWMKQTCITFEPKKDNDPNYLSFEPLQGCYSYIGMVGGHQRLSVGLPHEFICRRTGNIIHELGHAIGFWHEQARPDRDDYVRIVWSNIHYYFYDEFEKYGVETIDSLNVPYDYDSIMHYPLNAFSINHHDTIVPLDPYVHAPSIGQRIQLSPLDILQANLLYNCPYIRHTELPPTNSSSGNPTPPKSRVFLIKNKETQTCLATLPTRDLDAVRRYSTQALYPVSVVPCNSSSSAQLWQWTVNNTILHVGTFLCLALHQEESKTILVLRVCKGSDDKQKWSCVKDFIEQASSGMCIRPVIPATTMMISRRETEIKDSHTIKAGEYKNGGISSSLQPPGPLAPSLVQEIEKELGKVLEELFQKSSTEEQGEDSMEEEEIGAQWMAEDGVIRYNVTLILCDRNDIYQEWLGISIKDGEEEEELTICSDNTTSGHNLPPCYPLDMEPLSSLAHGTSKWLTCSPTGYYMNGFYHTYNIYRWNLKETGRISGVKCCTGDYAFTGLNSGPTSVDRAEKCHDTPWRFYRNFIMSRGWFICPRGMFVKAFLVTVKFYVPDENEIKMAKCCKPQVSPDEYMHCYTDKGTSVADTGIHSCLRPGYHITGMLRKNCNRFGVLCDEEITCCMQV